MNYKLVEFEKKKKMENFNNKSIEESCNDMLSEI